MNIVIIEQNTIYRKSLKTVLSQIDDFKIVFDSDNGDYLDQIPSLDIDLILLDFSIEKMECDEIIKKAIARWKAVKIILLLQFKEESINKLIGVTDIIFKTSTKKDFENKIRETQLNKK
ncbi:MAG: response regulator [Bacteroidota bacterium]